MKVCKDRELPTWLIRYKKNFIPNKDREIQYCLCRKPYKGEFMIQCDSYAEWFHGHCVHVIPKESRKIDKYQCPKSDQDCGKNHK